ncbi:MAG TPA: DinB family protein [Iamia sp.]
MGDEIVPDDKDWTWVLERPCPECGFVASTVAVEDVAPVVRANAARWVEVLGGPDVTVRPQPDVWSPLEYACHVRDVFRLFDTRLHLMLDTDGAGFANWDQDETAVAERYGEQDPAVVTDELTAAAEVLAASFAAVTPDQHDRTGLRSDGSQFTVTTFAQYLVHDPVHHVWDVTGVPAGAQEAVPS